jgi:site-specific DNA recombinase
MARKKTNYNHTLPDLSGKEKAVIYVRVSSQNQVKDGNGLESQERLCREWAEYNGIEVVQVFSD